MYIVLTSENGLSSRTETDVISNIVNTVQHYRELQNRNNEPLKYTSYKYMHEGSYLLMTTSELNRLG